MGNVYCITGGIGSGKSSVARLLSAYANAPLIDIDTSCKELLSKGHKGWQALKDAFGNTYFDASGSVDRQRLRATLFAEPELRARIDGLLHPLARVTLAEEIAQYDSELLFVEVPLVFEAGWQKDFDDVIVVAADPAVQIQRILFRDGVERKQAEQSINAQMKLEKKIALADYVVDNNGAWADTRNKVVKLCLLLEKKFGCSGKKT